MKLGELIKLFGYTIENDLDYNLMQFVLNLEVKQEIVNIEDVENKEVKKENTKPKSIKRKSTETFLEKLSKYKQGDAERDFIINILENDYRYEAYKYTYLEWSKLNIEDYTKEKVQSLSDVSYLDIYNITDGRINEFDIVDGIEDIDKMIDIFKEKVLPPVELDAVYEAFSDIFEKVVGETRGFLKDIDGKWYKFGNDSYKDLDLLCIKYPSLAEAMQDEDARECFLSCLIHGTDDYLYDYNEKEIIKEWY